MAIATGDQITERSLTVLLAFATFQRQFVSGLTTGALKA